MPEQKDEDVYFIDLVILTKDKKLLAEGFSSANCMTDWGDYHRAMKNIIMKLEEKFCPRYGAKQVANPISG